MIIIKTKKINKLKETWTYDTFNDMSVRTSATMLPGMEKTVYHVITKINGIMIYNNYMNKNQYENWKKFLHGIQRINTELLGYDVNFNIIANYDIASEFNINKMSEEDIHKMCRLYNPDVLFLCLESGLVYMNIPGLDKPEEYYNKEAVKFVTDALHALFQKKKN